HWREGRSRSRLGVARWTCGCVALHSWFNCWIIGWSKNWERDRKAAALAGLTLDSDGTAMHFDHAMDKRQSEPGAAIFSRKAGIQLHERLEKSREVLLPNPNASVPDAEFDHTFGPTFDLQADLARFRSKL